MLHDLCLPYVRVVGACNRPSRKSSGFGATSPGVASVPSLLCPRRSPHLLPRISVAPAVKVQPLGEESSWNVDGELMTNNSVSIAVQRGLVDVFARGVELVAPLS